MKTINKATLLNNILTSLNLTKSAALGLDLGYCLELKGNFSKDVQSIVEKYDNFEINLNGVIMALSFINKNPRTKIQGVKASFQSDKGCSYISVILTKYTKQTEQTLIELFNVLTSNDWGYDCGEFIGGERLSVFGDSEKTIKQMKDDYQAALKVVLNNG